MGYEYINTDKDVVKERFIWGADLVGKYGFPQLPKVTGNPEGLKPVSFGKISKEKKPREAIAHCFTQDEQFERLWNRPDDYLQTLGYYKFVCTPDFSCYGCMPMAMQIYQTYRNRALAYYLWTNDINIIPTVGWGMPDSYEWCFDGLPQNSLLAVSTNGCHDVKGKMIYAHGFHEMCERLNPSKVICVGSPIEVIDDVDIIYFKGDSQLVNEKLREQDGK